MDDYRMDYYWNGWSVANEYFSDDAEEAYGFSKTYVGGLGERFYAGGAYSYYFTDHLGTTEALYNESKTRTGGIEYTAWGEILSTDGAAASVTRRYTGHDYDPLTGDYFAPFRFYSPGSHRWLTRDPLGMVDGPNVYAYVGGRPGNTLDVLGLYGYWCHTKSPCFRDYLPKWGYHCHKIDPDCFDECDDEHAKAVAECGEDFCKETNLPGWAVCMHKAHRAKEACYVKCSST